MKHDGIYYRAPSALIALVIMGISTTQPAMIYAQAVLGAREIGMGQATTALPGTTWSVFENPAMLTGPRHSVSFFAIRYYGLPELSDLAAVVVYPTTFGILGGGVHRYGDDLFSETRFRLTYSNDYQQFYYGAAITYHHVAQGGGYASFGTFGFDIGIAALVLDDLWLAARATNITRARYGTVNSITEELPRNLSVGLSYRLSGIALFSTDLIKDVRFPISYRGGVELIVLDPLTARVGVTTAPQTVALGLGYNAKRWAVNITVQRHEDNLLGYSPGIDVNIYW